MNLPFLPDIRAQAVEDIGRLLDATRRDLNVLHWPSARLRLSMIATILDAAEASDIADDFRSLLTATDAELTQRFDESLRALNDRVEFLLYRRD